MRSLLNFILKYNYFILFIILEAISLLLLVNYNYYQKTFFINSSNNITGSLYSTSHSVSQYFGLRKNNIELSEAIAQLQNENKSAYKENKVSILDIYDSVYTCQYQYIPVQIVNNSVNKQNNYITINKGKKQGIEPDMAVVSATGVVGIVKYVSNNYSSVISLLNNNLKISAMVKKNNYFGTFEWQNNNPKYGTLNDLPNHLYLKKGDTIITSGYSAIFPKGKLIGLVSEVSKSEGGDFLVVKVRIATDFNNLNNVFVIKNMLKEEQLQLENITNND